MLDKYDLCAQLRVIEDDAQVERGRSSMFTRKLVNRTRMPMKHVLVCEDVIRNQAQIAAHFETLFAHEGEVQASFVCGAEAAAAVLSSMEVDLILLDHDMPCGDGPELLKWMKSRRCEVPVITFSGIPANNDHLIRCGAEHRFEKAEVIRGDADGLIKELLRISEG
ncbi:MAG TPA: response regulator [Planctomycetota bacterium]|nr:response regulator [Planctomycetota bacterium]